MPGPKYTLAKTPLAIGLLVSATLLGSGTTLLSHTHAGGFLGLSAGFWTGAMLACELSSFAAALTLLRPQLRHALKAPEGRGGSHL